MCIALCQSSLICVAASVGLLFQAYRLCALSSPEIKGVLNLFARYSVLNRLLLRSSRSWAALSAFYIALIRIVLCCSIFGRLLWTHLLSLYNCNRQIMATRSRKDDYIDFLQPVVVNFYRDWWFLRCASRSDDVL